PPAAPPRTGARRRLAFRPLQTGPRVLVEPRELKAPLGAAFPGADKTATQRQIPDLARGDMALRHATDGESVRREP
ncbi:MAG TPA: hypothetical protein P5195_03755, partial [Anaerolineae bacterium]|nr:hypothetical protein [Anaerolineae bacterium]